ncbi:Suf-domain-containing protein [Polychaeton citri CBS 116435]|uniref:mRNA 3'-end-processing protein RNA14 n=1 Tax=Polychaeton citri CBS 116435 TaxID=1314669 RepID=A0A9P4UKE6_9PEZI|nr:Suf-domain-containing protein [Polychaeton citri CBS 116435]
MPVSVAESAAGSVQPQAQQLGTVPPVPSRLPHDKVGQLEDRIQQDPRADTDAWLSLIAHYREKGQLDQARKTYERLLEVFPDTASLWYDYAKMEWDLNELNRLEQILSKSLQRSPSVKMWSFYLDYLRRRNPLTNDVNNEKRNVLTQAFEVVLDRVGIDPDAGPLWHDYIDFIKNGPGVVGAPGWQNAQKMDMLRAAYGKACALPQSELVRLWKEYDNFELGINKATGRKFLQEKSPAYMTAKTAKTQLDQIVDILRRDGLPTLQPHFGCEGRKEWDHQVSLWKRWVAWETEDPLVLKDEDFEAYRKRIKFVWQQATCVMRFCPELYFEAAQWCFDQATEQYTQEGDAFLDAGIVANPESVLLALRKVDRIESGLTSSEDDEAAESNGKQLDAPFEKCHKALYDLQAAVIARRERGVAKVREHFANLPPDETNDQVNEEDDDDDSDDHSDKVKKLSREEHLQEQIKNLMSEYEMQIDTLKRTISYLWVCKMQAFRRVLGQGNPKTSRPGFRTIFGTARRRGQLTSDVYIASALIEYHCYKDPSSTRIFERGLKLFPADEVFTLEYIKHLISINDVVNARAVFETTVTKIMGLQNLNELKKKSKCLSLFQYMHGFEGKYGDLAQIHRLEKRMKEMYDGPNDIAQGDMSRLATRGAIPGFDVRTVELVISPVQTRPKASAAASLIAQQPLAQIRREGSTATNSPRVGEIKLGPHGPYLVGASPKRALDDSDTDNTPRKFMRAESPLKGTPTMRIATLSGNLGTPNSIKPSAAATAAAAAAGTIGSGGFMTKTFVPGVGLQTTGGPQGAAPGTGGAQPLPPFVQWALSIIPGARDYHATHFDASKILGLVRDVDLSRASMRQRAP